MKYMATSAIDGMERQLVPIPIQMPCARNTCQYVELMLVIINPKTTRKDPETRSV